VGDFIIRSGDMILIMINPPAMVPHLQAPVPLAASTESIIFNGTPACVVGDEVPPPLRGPMPYTAPPFTVPGVGTVTVTLEPGNMTVQTRAGGKPLLIKGGTFPATFIVETPAMQPTPAGPVPDPLMVKPGTAQFVTTDETVIAN
jgi:Contractile injection system spike tip protein